MAINGIETVLYGVNDVAECTRFFIDFGLPLLANVRLPSAASSTVPEYLAPGFYKDKEKA